MRCPKCHKAIRPIQVKAPLVKGFFTRISVSTLRGVGRQLARLHAHQICVMLWCAQLWRCQL